MSNPRKELALVSGAVNAAITRKGAAALGQAAAASFGEAVRGGRSYADLLARLWAQVDSCMVDIEARNLETKEKAQILATVARILPQLQAAEQTWRMAIDQRAISTLTGRELSELVRDIDSRQPEGG